MRETSKTGVRRGPIPALLAFCLLAACAACLVIPIGGTKTITVSRPSENPELLAVEMARSALPVLRRAEAELETLLPRLRQGGGVGEYGELLAEVDAELLTVFRKPEASALRDAVKVEVERATGTLGVRGRLDVLQPSVRLAVQRPRRADHATLAGEFLDFLTSLRRRAENDDLLVDLCVQSSPTGASVVLYPKSARDRKRVTQTDGVILQLWRGFYFYRVVRDGNSPILCEPQGDAPSDCGLDLLQLDRPMLVCELAEASARGPVFCRQRTARGRECKVEL